MQSGADVPAVIDVVVDIPAIGRNECEYHDGARVIRFGEQADVAEAGRA
jgi:hypothetical protein